LTQLVSEVWKYKTRKTSQSIQGELKLKAKVPLDGFLRFKLHLVINNLGEIMTCSLTSANTDDKKTSAKTSRKP